MDAVFGAHPPAPGLVSCPLQLDRRANPLKTSQTSRECAYQRRVVNTIRHVSPDMPCIVAELGGNGSPGALLLSGRNSLQAKTTKKKQCNKNSRLYYPFGKGPGQHIIRCLKNKKCENERTKRQQTKTPKPSAHARPVPLLLIILPLSPPTVLLPIFPLPPITLPPFLLSLILSTPSFSAYVLLVRVRSSSTWAFNVCLCVCSSGFFLLRPLGS